MLVCSSSSSSHQRWEPISSYLKKKGENLATHEDVDKLVKQVSAVTAATKQIEANITRASRDFAT
jgi:hypothetical protein